MTSKHCTAPLYWLLSLVVKRTCAVIGRASLLHVLRLAGFQIVLMPTTSSHPITQNPSDQAQQFREQVERFRCREHFQSAQTTPMTEICSNLVFSSSAAVYDGADGKSPGTAQGHVRVGGDFRKVGAISLPSPALPPGVFSRGNAWECRSNCKSV